MEWWIWHSGVVQVLPWILGLALAGHSWRGRPWGSTLILGVLATMLLGTAFIALDLPRPEALDWLVGERELTRTARWLGVAALAASQRAMAHHALTWRSALALALLPVGTVGGLVTGVLLASTGALEADRRARGPLLAGLAGLLGAEAAAAHGLWCWGLVKALTGLDADPASLAVDLGIQVLAALGWAGLLLWATSRALPSRREVERQHVRAG